MIHKREDVYLASLDSMSVLEIQTRGDWSQFLTPAPVPKKLLQLLLQA